ncbi:vacuolar import and degradation protein-domain-containing protein [Lasiosphaeris hirsuta]|uniref:Vacuolar import and degradation protein-domain-containing protein n=1 Tax=Lasiosphaeris hirsuta TaxID=260670 RepID=A0AA40AHG0_9PEZI|nr:vacuolar import and degradation protein-domain-containing protein [Lasiosphaeris hirsuta]
MPTPSSNAPDPPSPRFYPFSSCPDPDEPAVHQSPQQSQSQPQSAPPTQPLPSNWRPRLLPGYPAPTVRTHMDEDIVESRSATMSPGPQPDSPIRDTDAERGRGREQDDAPVISRDGTEEDGHKLADVDEDMLGDGSGPVHGSGEVTRDTDGESSGVRSAARTIADGNVVSRRKQTTDLVSPAVGEFDNVDIWNLVGSAPRWVEDSGLVGLGYEYSQMRVIPTSPSSYLRPGSRFTGTQQSERQRYDVQVEIKHVDLRESFLCGYLKIQGLTDDHPTLTTYFEGEIIGSKYGFITQHPSWGATDKIDLSHWAKFTAFRPFAKQARKGGQVLIKDVAQYPDIFMRWKEHFLVPDHRVRTINGASFEGFYYICFNQVRGEVSGIYFHSKSEKFQQLELKHVEDKGCFGAMEFR